MQPERFLRVIGFIEKTPFGHFLRIPNHKVEVNLLNELLSRFNIESVSFDIGGSHLKFEDKEVAMILGLRLHGLPIDLQSRSRSTFLDGFLKEKPLKRSLLTKMLKSISQEQEDDIENTVRLLLIALFNFVLFLVGEGDISIGLYQCVDDLEKLGEYAWGNAVYKLLVSQLQKELQKKKRCGYLSGCNMTLTSLSCLQPVSNEEASYISPLEEGSTLELAAKDRENQQLREQVGHLEELLSLREGCGVGEDMTM
ncbi:hypothetical protein H6P81_012170 [Aristolochia fimbriata]|uniref:Aminotransferase-like plant mobile domain-containing protein n=1 Tax=Aristolochia fimbriata TaxID=158543 RepID=A0AAV7EEA5_ARIFI|nr:hypothetical protein H6P81_012170 [Aristolochia fimbriata]